jgi:hypothetical protein
MGRYACPICDEDVSPVRLGRAPDGEIIPSVHGRLVERKRCPACGVSLERTPLDRWRTAGSFVSARQLAEFRSS